MIKDDLIASDWNSIDYLNTEEDMAFYLQSCLDEAGDNPAFIKYALENIANARARSHLTNPTETEGLDKTLSGEILPNFSLMLKTLKSLGLKVCIQSAV